jgi:hypothetical protein
MRALTSDELSFVSGGGTPIADQQAQDARDRMNDALTAMGLDASYILGSVGTGGDGSFSFTGGVGFGCGGNSAGTGNQFTTIISNAVRNGTLTTEQGP